MKCCGNNRFINQQVYLQTVCCNRKPCKPKRKRPHDCNYLECGMRIPCGKLTVRCDREGISMNVDVCCKSGKTNKDDCD